MNIMFLATTYYPHVGGLEQVARSLGGALRREGHQVVVVTERRPWRLAAREQHDGITVYRVPFVAAGVSLHGRAVYPFLHSYTMMRLRQVVRQHSVDLIHLQGVSRNSPYGRELSQGAGIPLVATIHGAEVDDVRLKAVPPHIHRWQVDQLVASVKVAAAFTAVSQDLAGKLIDLVPAAEATLSVIPNGTDPADLQLTAAASDETPGTYLLGVGRLLAKKGFDVLLDALGRLYSARGPAMPPLVLVGDGPERAALEARARGLGIADRVRWEGALADRGRLGRLYLGCRLCVVPSRQESFGMVCLEALAAGRPVVASAVGGIPETVRDGVDGLLVPPDDPEALATAIARVLDGAATLAPAAALRARAETFSWQAVVRRYLDLYSTALARSL